MGSGRDSSIFDFFSVSLYIFGEHCQRSTIPADFYHPSIGW